MLEALTPKRVLKSKETAQHYTPFFDNCHLLVFMKISLAPQLQYLKWIALHKGRQKSSLFLTLKSMLKFELFQLTSKVAEVKGGLKKNVQISNPTPLLIKEITALINENVFLLIQLYFLCCVSRIAVDLLVHTL